MNIRKAVPDDALAIKKLVEQLGYELTPETIRNKIERFIHDPDELLLVYTMENSVTGFISIHFIPQIATTGDFAKISYFCVDEKSRGQKIGEELEKYCVQKARERGCDRIELHSHSRRTDAHRFYERLGYSESPKYFIKRLEEK